MNNQENIQKELKNIAPILASLPKNNDKPMPNAIYFEGMQQRVLQQIAIEAPVKNISTNNDFEKILQRLLLIFHPKFSLAYMMAIALVIMADYYKEVAVADSTVAVSTAVLFIEEENISEEAIAQYLSEADIEDLENQLAENNTLPENSLEQYILENNLETLPEEEYL